jgi:hypothetical protein
MDTYIYFQIASIEVLDCKVIYNIRFEVNM